MTAPQNAVVIALGNRFRGDDGIGPAVARALRGRLGGSAIVEGGGDPFAIMAAWEGAALAVVVDAAASGAPPGTIHRFEAGATPPSRDLARCSSHGLGLAEALELGELLGRLPARLVVYAVEAGAFGRGAPLSPGVSAAVPEVVQRIEAEIASFACARGNAPCTSTR